MRNCIPDPVTCSGHQNLVMVQEVVGNRATPKQPLFWNKGLLRFVCLFFS